MCARESLSCIVEMSETVSVDHNFYDVYWQCLLESRHNRSLPVGPLYQWILSIVQCGYDHSDKQGEVLYHLHCSHMMDYSLPYG